MEEECGVFPRFEVEDRVFSKVLLGHNPFLGFSYLSQARTKEYERRFSEAAAIEAIITRAIELGVRGMMLSTGGTKCEDVVTALEAACKGTGVTIPSFIIVGPDFQEHRALLERANCQVTLLHGQRTDALFIKAQSDFQPEFAALMEEARRAGFVPGMSTHNAGETVPAAEKYDVAVVNTPVNRITWRMCPCEEQVLEVLARTSKKVIAMKPLAMGRIPPREAMQYVLRRPEVDATVVGIATVEEAEETFGLCAGLV
ncbi:MAG: hypothetical protein HY318_01100 [Armatimonadetes bacterium]|nr:hypothetical protein [Armatimonadota bacterium]